MKKICILLLFVAAGTAQTQSRLEGEVVAEGNSDLSGLTVRLRTTDRAGYPESARVEHDGRFSFSGVPSGTYLLEVLDGSGEEVVWQQVTVLPTNAPLSVPLPTRHADRPAGRTVSAARLLHPPDSRAVRDAARAQKFAPAGSHERAAAELEKAVSEDPHYAEAFNNLGVQYVKLHRLAEANEAFRQAAALDPASSVPRTNLAVMLAQAGRLREAVEWARQGVRLDPANELARNVLESLLAAEVAAEVKVRAFVAAP